MEELLEPLELLAVGEDDLGDRRAVDLAGLVEDPLAEAVEEGTPHLVVVAQQPVDDLVARDHGGAVAREGGEGLAFPRSDAARDGDGERPGLIQLLGRRRGFAFRVAGARLLGRYLIRFDARVELFRRRLLSWSL